ncbi:hypothetical protein [Chryseobacterium koreense]|uniref:Phage tail collar domain-containing protein n=1 Tax=Chryseobacterium koreense CCUG 49689 TaxID=1304281 RepID=A0A0J7LMC9_9FLAO|nr:hypothetical protein [Chryseobacterium koreense]KMQ70250.1 hypothetical protein ACM44_13435 [Chryseobacterium koreense CCUG 49689]MBB5334751.1 hypothetical protein [Chryseobacterium koreense]
MKYNFKFLQTGGVPLTNDLMSLIEEAYQIFEVLGDLAGSLTILSGCNLVGSTVEPGIVAIEGKLYYFEGGLVSDTVYIHKEEILKTFQDQTDKILIEKRTVKFGNAITTYNWDDFVKLDTLKDIQSKVNNSVTQQQLNALITEIDILKLKTAPIINGGIVFPFRRPASEIPAGWKECIDFRGKTIVGRDPNDGDFANLGNTIGTKTHTLQISEIPNHSHAYTRTSPWSGSGGGFSGGGNTFDISAQNTSAVGGGQAHNNIQPSRIVNFIEPNFQ